VKEPQPRTATTIYREDAKSAKKNLLFGQDERDGQDEGQRRGGWFLRRWVEHRSWVCEQEENLDHRWTERRREDHFRSGLLAAGWRNFEELYRDLADAWVLYDNAGKKPQLTDWGEKP